MTSLFRHHSRLRVLVLAAVLIFVSAPGSEFLRGDDWPEWRGQGRRGVWKESGILNKFPASELTAAWRVPVREGYSGPAVANGRVFVTDYIITERPRGTERVLALDERTGRVLSGISILSFPFTRKPIPATLSCQPQTALASLRW